MADLNVALILRLVDRATGPARAAMDRIDRMSRGAMSRNAARVDQGARMMAAGIIAYGVSVTLNIWLFDRLRNAVGRFAAVRGFIAAALSQIVDTVIFIGISFYGVRPIMDLMIGQAIAKVVLSALLVPLIVVMAVRIGRRLDAAPA